MRPQTILCSGIAGLLLILSAGGCFGSARPVRQYDLQTSQSFADAACRAGAFSNGSGAGLRMQYRLDNGTVLTDPDNQWILAPGALLGRALNRALNRDGNPVKHSVSGSIDCFEVNSKRMEFQLGGFYSISGIRGSRRFDISVPLQAKTPDAIASAASAAAGELASRIAKQVQE